MGTPENIAAEQAYVDTLFAHLDAEVTAAQEKLAAVQRDVDPDNPDSDALVRRETEYHGLNAKLDALNIAAVSYTHLTLPTTLHECRSRWSPYH